MGQCLAAARTETSDVEREERVLVIAPVGRDGPMTVGAVREHGYAAELCVDTAALCAEMQRGAGVLIITSEALDGDAIAVLAGALERQPPWSDLPVILLASPTQHSVRDIALQALGNVTVLEKPLRLPSLLSAVRAATLARQRQYQVRDLLAAAERAREEAERQQARIEALNERLQRAMTETHHRVKNNLQVIAAMIDMQILDDKDAVPLAELRRLSAHVQTLAAVHDMLTQQARQDGQASHVSAAEVVRKLVPLLEQTTGGRHIGAHADDFPLSARQGTSLALIVSELVSNALKHGAGDIHVELRHERACARLRVRDHGDGFGEEFDPALKAHTGLDLIGHLSRWDLGGEARYENAPDGGACVTITFPMQPGLVAPATVVVPDAVAAPAGEAPAREEARQGSELAPADRA